ncbi:MAG: hypothetical protein C0597_03320 [Marinilabiliales bacterium]|nr:MAG: hypothetical protein C0597_03320 [Marinilabiliales bacterium]
MKEFSIISVSIINIVIGVRYCTLTYKQKIKPALAMWAFFTMAVAMSLTTYMAEGNFSLWDNILNTTDLVLVATVTVFIFIYGDTSTKFTRFDKFCLVAVILITVFWLITKTHFLSHSLIQGILVIAYFPVIRRLWLSKENTEPFSVWILLMIAPIFSLLSSKGTLATVYVLRAIASTAILMILMLRVEYLKNKSSKEDIELDAMNQR